MTVTTRHTNRHDMVLAAHNQLTSATSPQVQLNLMLRLPRTICVCWPHFAEPCLHCCWPHLHGCKRN
jgi:hypothetical protein